MEIKKFIVGSRTVIKESDLKKDSDMDYIIIRNPKGMLANYLFFKETNKKDQETKEDVIYFKDGLSKEEIAETIKNVKNNMIVCSFLSEGFCKHYGFKTPNELKGLYESKNTGKPYQDKAFEFYCLNKAWTLTEEQYKIVLKLYLEE
jgi:hypothetical protein